MSRVGGGAIAPFLSLYASFFLSLRLCAWNCLLSRFDKVASKPALTLPCLPCTQL